MEQMNSLIVVKQLPVIEQQLLAVKEEVAARVQDALALECTAETVKEVKKIRAELNKDLKEFEERRKAVKKAVLAPYEEFETLYKDCISDQYKTADVQLRDRIAEVESTVLKAKCVEVQEYFNEYAQSMGIDFVPFERAVPNVTLSASMKSLKEAAKNFLDKVDSDIKLIQTMQDVDEIMVEYKRHYDVSLATRTVLERHVQIEKEKERADQKKAENTAEIKPTETVVAEDVPLTAPAVVETEYSATFKVTGSIEQLRALKAYMTAHNLKFETAKENGNG